VRPHPHRIAVVLELTMEPSSTPFSGACPRRWLRWLYVLATAVFLLLVAARWDARSGFTSLLRFGDDFTDSRLPAVAKLPIVSVPGLGYDGQFYAQLAVEPDPRAPDLQKVLDLPRYRARRILLPWIAHGLSAGNPWWALNVYALLNVGAWLVAAWWLGRRLATEGWRGLAVWTACLFSVGALDSVRFALTDLPAMLTILIAVDLSLRGRKTAAAVLLGAGGMVRETTVLAAPLLLRPWPRDRSSWLAGAARGLIAFLPLALWVGWLLWKMPADTGTGVEGNFDWPGFALGRHLFTCFAAIYTGTMDPRYIFGAIAVLGLAYQSCFVLSRLKQDSVWISVAAPFAVLFWLLGDSVWHGYWAAERALLPLTFAFNLLLLREPRFWWRLILANACLIHGIYRFLP
jgi:hypothetical protein